MSLPVRSAASDESEAAYESAANVRSAAADEAGAAYESECEREGLYGALKTVPGGPYGAEKLLDLDLPGLRAEDTRGRGSLGL